MINNTQQGTTAASAESDARLTETSFDLASDTCSRANEDRDSIQRENGEEGKSLHSMTHDADPHRPRHGWIYGYVERGRVGGGNGGKS